MEDTLAMEDNCLENDDSVNGGKDGTSSSETDPRNSSNTSLEHEEAKDEPMPSDDDETAGDHDEPERGIDGELGLPKFILKHVPAKLPYKFLLIAFLIFI